MEENTHRFSGHQQVSDITFLLWRLGSSCMDHMQNLLHGTDYKHGYMDKEERKELLNLMMDIAQELCTTQEEIAEAWVYAEQYRATGHALGKEWVDKYGE